MGKIFQNIKILITCIKKPYYTLRKNRINTGTIVERNVFMRNSHFGKYSYVGPNGCYNDAHIGNYCSFAVGVQVGGMEHAYWDISTSTRLSDSCISGKITSIGHDVWIGADSIIKQGVTIGNGAVIGANSFVNKDVPPYAIVFGTPAKVFKFRFNEETIREIEESRFWDFKPSKAKEIITQLKFNK